MESNNVNLDSVRKVAIKYIIGKTQLEHSFVITYDELYKECCKTFGEDELLNIKFANNNSLEYIKKHFPKLFEKYSYIITSFNIPVLTVICEVTEIYDTEKNVLKQLALLESDLNFNSDYYDELLEATSILNDYFYKSFWIKRLMFYPDLISLDNRFKNLEDLYIISLFLFKQHSKTGGLTLLQYVSNIYYKVGLDIEFDELANLYNQIVERTLSNKLDFEYTHQSNLASLRSMMALLEYEELQQALKQSEEAMKEATTALYWTKLGFTVSTIIGVLGILVTIYFEYYKK